MSRAEWLVPCKDGLTLRVIVQPRARKTEVVGIFGQPSRLKIKIAAPPVDDAANDVLLDFLAEKLALPTSKLQLLRGHKSKSKDVLCTGHTERDCVAIETLLLSDTAQSKS